MYIYLLGEVFCIYKKYSLGENIFRPIWFTPKWKYCILWVVNKIIFCFFDFEDLIGEFQERKRKIITRKKNINILDWHQYKKEICNKNLIKKANEKNMRFLGSTFKV